MERGLLIERIHHGIAKAHAASGPRRSAVGVDKGHRQAVEVTVRIPDAADIENRVQRRDEDDRQGGQHEYRTAKKREFRLQAQPQRAGGALRVELARDGVGWIHGPWCPIRGAAPHVPWLQQDRAALGMALVFVLSCTMVALPGTKNGGVLVSEVAGYFQGRCLPQGGGNLSNNPRRRQDRGENSTKSRTRWPGDVARPPN